MRELQDSVDRLQSFEAELKNKLKEFLNRQQEALQSLNDRAPAATGVPTPGVPATNGEGRRAAHVVTVEKRSEAAATATAEGATQEQEMVVDSEFPDFQPSEEPDYEPDSEPQRRGLRSLFHRDEE